MSDNKLIIKECKNTFVLPINTATINGRVYTKEAVEKALQDPVLIERCLQLNGLPVLEAASDALYEYANKGTCKVEDIKGFVKNFNLKDDGLYADITLIDFNDKKKNILVEDGQQPEISFRAFGKGDVVYISGIGVVENYELLGVDIGFDVKR